MGSWWSHVAVNPQLKLIKNRNIFSRNELLSMIRHFNVILLYLINGLRFAEERKKKIQLDFYKHKKVS